MFRHPVKTSHKSDLDLRKRDFGQRIWINPDRVPKNRSNTWSQVYLHYTFTRNSTFSQILPSFRSSNFRTENRLGHNESLERLPKIGGIHVFVPFDGLTLLHQHQQDYQYSDDTSDRILPSRFHTTPRLSRSWIIIRSEYTVQINKLKRYNRREVSVTRESNTTPPPHNFPGIHYFLPKLGFPIFVVRSWAFNRHWDE